MTTDNFEVHIPRWRRQWSRADRAEETITSYISQVRKYVDWCRAKGCSVNSLESADTYIAEVEKHSRHMARFATRALRAYGKYLVADQLADRNRGVPMNRDCGPFHFLTLPPEPVPLRTPTANDGGLEALLATCDKPTKRAGNKWIWWDHLRDRAIILTMAHTGMRRGEVADMKMQWLDLANELIMIPKTKTGQTRRIYLGEEATGAILRYLAASERERPKNGEAVWYGILGWPLEPFQADGISRMLTRRGKRAGVDVSQSHAFRRRHTGEWLARGGGEATLMTNNGWTSPAMIRRYAKDSIEDTAIAEARRLFGKD